MGIRRILVVAGAVASVIAAQSPASAADTSPPSLRTPLKSSWVVPSQLSQDFVVGCASNFEWGTSQVWVSAYQTMKWRGWDRSRPVTYSVVEQTKGEGPGSEIDLGTARSLTRYTTNSNQGCGGGSWMPSGWDITATDGSGNFTEKSILGGLFTFTQENNTYDDSYYAAKTRISYSRGWRKSHCTCWSDRGTKKAIRKGASATLRFFDSRDGLPTHVGLVMHKGPTRGKFRVLVNGVRRATVDLYAPANQPRTIVWQGAVQLTDVVKLVNLATPGRQRIDLDGVLTN